MINCDGLVRDGNLKDEMTAAVYARIARFDLTEHNSLEEQADMDCEFARKLGYSVPEGYIFSEQASGLDPERSKLLSLLDLVDSGRVDAVIVRDPSRLSRDISTLLMILMKCEEAGVRLLTLVGWRLDDRDGFRAIRRLLHDPATSSKDGGRTIPKTAVNVDVTDSNGEAIK